GRMAALMALLGLSYFRAKDCRLRPSREPLLNAIIAGLLLEARIPTGAIVDAGAADGRTACYFAAIAPDRLVHAVDPSYRNVLWIERKYGTRYQNLLPFHGGLGDQPAANQSERKSMVTANQNFTIFRLDDLFEGPWKGQTMALGHFDVERWEERVLRGALRVIKRDAPLLTTEVEVQRRPQATASLLHLLDDLGYDSFLIEEITGMSADLRNLLHVPRSRMQAFQGSNILDVAVASRSLFAVVPDNINEFAYPCCRSGGACCPDAYHCCSHALVSQWLNSVIRSGGADLQWYSRTSWYDQHQHTFRSELFDAQEEERRRNISTAGMSFNTPIAVRNFEKRAQSAGHLVRQGKRRRTRRRAHVTAQA
ncbi:MAG: hypothetical protein SGPRY_014490, partial [Prymnesium sp.]